MKARSLLMMLAALAATACSSVRVTTDFDPEADFSQYRTWKWMDDGPQMKDVRVASELVQKRIRSAAELVLREKGFEMVDADPDFELAWTASVQDKVEYDTFNYAHGRGRYGTYWASDTQAYEYTEGTLVLDVHDAKSLQLVWRGIGVGTIREGGEPEERTERTTNAVREILEAFPPGR